MVRPDGLFDRPDELFELKYDSFATLAILLAWQDAAISRIPHRDFLTRSRLLTAVIIEQH